MTVTLSTMANTYIRMQFKEPFMLPHLFELVLRALTAVVDPNYNPRHIMRTFKCTYSCIRAFFPWPQLQVHFKRG